jgi:hypothetical protein
MVSNALRYGQSWQDVAENKETGKYHTPCNGLGSWEIAIRSDRIAIELVADATGSTSTCKLQLAFLQFLRRGRNLVNLVSYRTALRYSMLDFLEFLEAPLV